MGPVDRAAAVVHRFITDRAAVRWPSSPKLTCAGTTGHNSLPRELLEEGEVEGNLIVGTDDGLVWPSDDGYQRQPLVLDGRVT
jgi:hypothetical protein